MCKFFCYEHNYWGYDELSAVKVVVCMRCKLKSKVISCLRNWSTKPRQSTLLRNYVWLRHKRSSLDSYHQIKRFLHVVDDLFAIYNAADFLEYIREQFLFRIVSIQVDGGSEFMGDFEQLCRAKAIPFYVLPPDRQTAMAMSKEVRV